MRMYLSQLVDELQYLVAYTTRTDLGTNRKVRALNVAQAEIEKWIASETIASGDLFLTRKQYSVGSSNAYTLPGNVRHIRYIEWGDSSDGPWLPIVPVHLVDRKASNNGPDSGIIRVWYSRVLAPMFQGTLDTGTTSTAAVLPSAPDYSSLGALESQNDTYTGSSLYSITDNEASEITGYTASTRIAVVSFSATVESGTEAALLSSLPDDLQQLLLYQALREIVPRERDVVNRVAELKDDAMRTLTRRQRQEPVLMGDRFVLDPEWDWRSPYAYHFFGNTLQVVSF